MKKSSVFYYRFRTNYVWLILNLLALAALIHCYVSYPAALYWPQAKLMIALFVVTLLLWCYKYLLRHPMAVLDDDGIKIDHCRRLLWKDIRVAEYRTAHCCFQQLDIIVLVPREGLRYQYNLLQKRCASMDFTAFSIALYDLSPQDREEIAEKIAARVPLTDRRQIVTIAV